MLGVLPIAKIGEIHSVNRFNRPRTRQEGGIRGRRAMNH